MDVHDVLSLQFHAGERQADPGQGARAFGDIRQVATRETCSVLLDRLGGAVPAHDPRPHHLGNVAGDWRT